MTVGEAILVDDVSVLIITFKIDAMIDEMLLEPAAEALLVFEETSDSLPVLARFPEPD